MKAEQYSLVSHEVKKNLVSRIMDIECDGKTKVVISTAGNKSQKQRGLQWKWYSEVADSGIGSCDDKDDIHIYSKLRWAVPILLRDDELFPIIYEHFIFNYASEEKKMKMFSENYVHTEKFSTSQMAEYLNDFERYWLSAGVNLINPDLYGLKLR